MHGGERVTVEKPAKSKAFPQDACLFKLSSALLFFFLLLLYCRSYHRAAVPLTPLLSRSSLSHPGSSLFLLVPFAPTKASPSGEEERKEQVMTCPHAGLTEERKEEERKGTKNIP